MCKEIHSLTPNGHYLPRRIEQAGMALMVGSTVIGLNGCAAERVETAPPAVAGAPVYEVPVARTRRVVVDVARFPRVNYYGQDLFLIDNRWFYRSDGGWVSLESDIVLTRGDAGGDVSDPGRTA